MNPGLEIVFPMVEIFVKKPVMCANGAVTLNWAITLFLIAIVGVAFSFLGTRSQIASLVGSIAAISCLLLALVLFAVYIFHCHRRSGAGN